MITTLLLGHALAGELPSTQPAWPPAPGATGQQPLSRSSATRSPPRMWGVWGLSLASAASHAWLVLPALDLPGGVPLIFHLGAWTPAAAAVPVALTTDAPVLAIALGSAVGMAAGLFAPVVFASGQMRQLPGYHAPLAVLAATCSIGAATGSTVAAIATRDFRSTRDRFPRLALTGAPWLSPEQGVTGVLIQGSFG